MTAQTSAVNLLPADKFEHSQWERFLLWLLSTVRLVLMLTELVVISVFLSRFWFDQKLSDLLQKRMQHTMVVQSMDAIRTEWERTQFLAEEINKVNRSNFDAAGRLAKIQELIPVGVEFESIKISSGSASLKGYVPRGDIFSRLFSKFKAEESYAEVIVEKLEQSLQRQPGFNFEIEIQIQNSRI